MSRINNDYVESFLWHQGSKKKGTRTLYAIRSSLDGFVLSGDAKVALQSMRAEPRIHLLAPGVRHMRGENIPEDLTHYEIKFGGLLIPYDQTNKTDGLDLGLISIRAPQFRATPLQQGTSFAVSNHKLVNYAIAPQHPQLKEILSVLGAPKDLLL